MNENSASTGKVDQVTAPETLPETPETLADFKNSFSYGSRSDLLFKFLKLLPPERAADFFETLLATVGDSLDDGDFSRVAEHLYEWQARGYEPAPGAKPRFDYADGPFQPLLKPLADSRVALISSGGLFMRGDDPKPLGVEGLTQAQAEARINDFMKEAPALSEIPVDAEPSDITVRHGGYDVRGARRDHNVVLPIDAMKLAEADGLIGELHRTAYSFVGAASQLRLRESVAPEWAARFKDEGIEALVMVPV